MDTQRKQQPRVTVYHGLIGVWVLLFLTACSSGIPDGELLGPKRAFTAPEHLKSDESVLVFFRDDEDRHAELPSVWVNDRLVGALQPGRYVEARVCSGDARVVLSRRNRSDVIQHSVMRLSAGQVNYVQVQRLTQDFALQPLDAETAGRHLARADRQSHLVNRSQAQCPEPAPEPMAKPLRQWTLATDALFRFDGAGRDALLPSGHQALRDLARDIGSASSSVQRLRIVGHADRLGSDRYNDRLSAVRAETVAAYLREQGVSLPMEVSGRGSREPVSRGCAGQRATAALIACLQPDRRVTVELWQVVSEQTSP